MAPDYAIIMFQIAGYKPGTVIDFEIPKKYGLRQTIGDTLGIGGILRPAHHPGLLDVCHDMEELCPQATMLNYVNPMAMNMWAIQRASKIKSIGLCHSVQALPGSWPPTWACRSKRSIISAPGSTTWPST